MFQNTNNTEKFTLLIPQEFFCQEFLKRKKWTIKKRGDRILWIGSLEEKRKGEASGGFRYVKIASNNEDGSLEKNSHV